MERFTSACMWMALLAGLTLCGCNYAANRHNCNGTRAFLSGQVAQAINEFQQALIANPQDANAYYNLGYAYAALAKQNQNAQWTEQAEQLFRQSIALNDQHVDAHRALAALLIEKGNQQFAFDLLNAWQQRYPSSPAPLIELARLYQEYGDNRRAADYLADALRLDSQNALAFKAMGHVREAQGQDQLALQNYLRAWQLDATQTDVAQRVAVLRQRLSQNQGLPGSPNLNRYGAASPFLQR